MLPRLWVTQPGCPASPTPSFSHEPPEPASWISPWMGHSVLFPAKPHRARGKKPQSFQPFFFQPMPQFVLLWALPPSSTMSSFAPLKAKQICLSHFSSSVITHTLPLPLPLPHPRHFSLLPLCLFAAVPPVLMFAVTPRVCHTGGFSPCSAYIWVRVFGAEDQARGLEPPQEVSLESFVPLTQKEPFPLGYPVALLRLIFSCFGSAFK